jgi:hypothetical protein
MRLPGVLLYKLDVNIPISDIARFRTGPSAAFSRLLFGPKSLRES